MAWRQALTSQLQDVGNIFCAIFQDDPNTIWSYGICTFLELSFELLSIECLLFSFRIECLCSHEAFKTMCCFSNCCMVISPLLCHESSLFSCDISHWRSLPLFSTLIGTIFILTRGLQLSLTNIQIYRTNWNLGLFGQNLPKTLLWSTASGKHHFIVSICSLFLLSTYERQHVVFVFLYQAYFTWNNSSKFIRVVAHDMISF